MDKAKGYPDRDIYEQAGCLAACKQHKLPFDLRAKKHMPTTTIVPHVTAITAMCMGWSRKWASRLYTHVGRNRRTLRLL
eukprot:1160152-Pelagomonas_calceolata.AAC.3